jgi:hypothetical protein
MSIRSPPPFFRLTTYCRHYLSRLLASVTFGVGSFPILNCLYWWQMLYLCRRLEYDFPFIGVLILAHQGFEGAQSLSGLRATNDVVYDVRSDGFVPAWPQWNPLTAPKSIESNRYYSNTNQSAQIALNFRKGLSRIHRRQTIGVSHDEYDRCIVWITTGGGGAGVGFIWKVIWKVIESHWKVIESH